MKYFKNLNYIIEFCFVSLFLDSPLFYIWWHLDFEQTFLFILLGFVFIEILLLFVLKSIIFPRICFYEKEFVVFKNKKKQKAINYHDIVKVYKENHARDWWITLETRDNQKIRMTYRKKVILELEKHLDSNLRDILMKFGPNPLK